MYKVSVKYLQETVEVEVEKEETVEVLQNKIKERMKIETRLKLTYKGNILSDLSKSMEELEIEEGAVIYANKIGVNSGPAEIDREVYKTETHPKLKDPSIKKLFNNPDIMKGLLDILPELKDENPEIKKLMESSDMLEQMSKLADDPEYMNTQMKNLDIAMAKLETIPGGFNMLRGMLKTQKDPSEILSEERERMNFTEGNKEGISKNPVPNPWRKYNFNPIVEYRKQVNYMKECGFTDVSSNIRLLIKHQGDVDGAISEIVMGSSMNSPHSEHKSR